MRFHLRDLGWLTIVVGAVCALWMQHRSAGIWQARAETLRQMVDTFEDPNHVEWTPNGAKLVYATRKPYEPSSIHGDASKR
jgi:hypothetical protein